MTQKIVVLDIETSGVEPAGNGIIEIRALIVDKATGKVLDTLQLLTKPKSPNKLSKIAEELTGITDSMLEVAPSNEIALKQLEEFIANQTVWAYNAPFLVAFLNKSTKRDWVIKDILSEVKSKLPNLKNYRLLTVAQHQNLTPDDHLGRMKDCYLTKDIIQKIID